MTTTIKVETTVNAPIEKTWNFWTDPQHITQWNFASDEWYCHKAENDVKVGGKMNVRMEAKDGSFGFDFEAIYDEVIENKKIKYNMADGRQATTTFENNNGKTIVTIVFDAENENPTEMQQEGWQAILNNFKKYADGFDG